MWSVVWALIPARYLYGIGAALAAFVVLWTGYSVHERRVHTQWFDKGAAFARDSAREATILREIALKDSVARSVVTKAKHADSLFNARLVSVIKGPRLTHVDSTGLVPTVPLSQLVAIYTADAPTTPHYADRYIGNLVIWYDSIVYRVLIPQRDSAVALGRAWKDAYVAEHDAHTTAEDSLSALLQSRSVVPERHASWKRKAALAAVAFTLGAIAHNNIRIR